MNLRSMMTARKLLLVAGLALIALFVFKTQNEIPANEFAVESVDSEPAVEKPSITAEQSAAQFEQLQQAVVPRTPAATEIDIDEVDKRRSAAKSQLAASYAAQRAFFAEFNRYTTDIIATGVVPNEPVIKFKMGFIEERPLPDSASTEVPDEDPRRKDTDSYLDEKFESTDENYSYSPEAEKINLSDFKDYCRDGCTADERGFEMLLVVPLDSIHSDIWLMNDKKEMVLVRDGLTGIL